MKTDLHAENILQFAVSLDSTIEIVTFLMYFNFCMLLFCSPLDGHSGFLKMTRAKLGKQIFVLSQSLILLKIFGRK